VPGSSNRPYDLTYVEPPCSISGPQSSAKKKRRLSPSNDAEIVETGGFQNSWKLDFATDKSPQSYVYDHPGRVEFQRNTPISNPNPENMVQQLAEQKFFDTWEARITNHPNVRSALQALRRFKALPQLDKNHPRMPYHELNLMMHYISGFGSHKVQRDLVASLRSLKSRRWRVKERDGEFCWWGTRRTIHRRCGVRRVTRSRSIHIGQKK
ncbi:MAG: hypothetical protein L6R42_007630, partial [Xanthoria sp. 1 TBL-2021]